MWLLPAPPAVRATYHDRGSVATDVFRAREPIQVRRRFRIIFGSL